SARVQVERAISQERSSRPRNPAIDDDSRGTTGKTDDVVRVRRYFQDHRAGDVGRTVINRQNRNLCRTFAGRNSYGAREGNLFDAVRGRAADSIVYRERIIGGAEATHNKSRVLGTSIG